MRAFLIASGTIFGLLVAAHIARISVEPQVARDPWFVLATLASAGLSAWAWLLLRRIRRS